MAEEKDLNLHINVSDQGSAKATADNLEGIKAQLWDITQLNKTLTKNIKVLEKEVQSSGKSAQQGVGSDSGLASAIREQHKQFDIARGAAASSGAAARDFANQSRGLGGVVRIYAALAANIFALGSAFRALSDSMQVSNMVKGLDQLGAAVGRNLGGLSERFVEISGGAISLAEGMRAVAQTSSGGLGAKDIERLAAVARSASTALGVAMPDAVNRLSRGITKLEPELLDELGIMTRLEPAVDKYAREMGKAASQLTQFERRQAFANAVLEEGEQKFGAISNISINPYDRLISALKDVTQVGTDVLNTVLAPIIEVLSKSPTALGLAITAIATQILKSAIPAIASFRDEIRAATENAADLAETRAKAVSSISSALEGRKEALEVLNVKNRTLAEEELIRTASRRANLEKALNKDILDSSRLGQILTKDINELTKADLKNLEVRERRLALKGPTQASAAFMELRKGLEREIEIQKELTQVSVERAKITEAVEIQSTALKNANKLAENARVAAIKQGIVANTAQNASLVGVSSAFKIMNLEIAATNLQLNGYQLALLKTRAVMAVFMSTLTGIVGALSTFLNVIAIVSATFAIISVALSKNDEELAKSRDALTAVSSAAENVSRTLANLDKQGLKGTIDGAFALSNAFQSVAESAENLVSTAIAAKAVTAGFDAAINSIRDFFFDSGIESNLAKGLTSSIEAAIKLSDVSGAGEEFKKKLSELLGTDLFDTTNIRKAVERLGDGARTELAKTIDKQNLLLNNASSRLQQFKTSTEAADLVFAQFIQTTSNNDPIFRVGAALEATARDMFNIANAAEAGASGIDEITAAIRFLSNNPDSAILFGPEFVDNLLDSQKMLDEESKAILELEKQIVETTKNLAKVPFNDALRFTDKDGNLITKTFKQLEELRINLTAELDDKILARSEASRKLFIDGMNSAFKRGAELIEVAGSNAAQRASIIVQRASLSGLTGEERARKETDLAVKDIDLKIQAIESSRELIISQERLRVAVEGLRAEQELGRLQDDPKASASDIAAAKQASAVAKVIQELIQPREDGGFKSPTVENALATKAAGGDEFIAQLAAVQSIGTLQRLAAQDQAKQLALAERQAAVIEGSVKIIKGRLQDEIAILQAKEKQVQADLSAQLAAQSLAGFSSEVFARANIQLGLTNLIIKQTQERLQLEAAIESATSTTEKQKQQALLTQVEERHEVELLNQELQNSQAIISARISDRQRELELVRSISMVSLSTAQSSIDLERARFEAQAQLSGLAQDANAAQLEFLGTQRAELEFVKTVSEELNILAAQRAEAQDRISSLNPDRDAGTIAEINARYQQQEDIANNLIESARVRLDLEKALLAVATRKAEQEQRFNRTLGNTQKIATSLSSSFGRVGSAVGSFVQGFAKTQVDLQKSNIQLKELIDNRAKFAGNERALAENEKKINIARNQQQIDQINNYGALVGAAKGFFKENTTGYKILQITEQAYTIFSLALTMQRMLADTAATEASLTNNATRMAGDVAEAEVSGVQAVINSIASMPFPANIAAGAAIAAIVAALLASIGGKGPNTVSKSAGISAEDVQEVQGTGQAFVNRKKVTRSGGSLGDSDSKVESIANSLELIQDNTNVTSVFGVRAVDLLSKIEVNTRGLTAELVRTTNITRAAGSFSSETGSSFKKIAVSPVLSGSVGKLIGGLFGTKTKVDVIDRGIRAAGALVDILEGAQAFQEFETLQVTKKRKRFGITVKTKKSFEENTRDLERTTNESFVALFNDLIDVSVFAAKRAFGEANNDIQRELESFTIDFKVSGFDLSGEEFAEALLAESSVAINQLLEKAFPALEMFREIGEGFIDTLIRISHTLDVTEDNFTRIGVSLNSITATPKVPEQLIQQQNAIQQALNSALDGLKVEARAPTLEQEGLVNATLDDLETIRASISESIGGFAEPLFAVLNSTERNLASAKAEIFDNKTATEELAAAERILTGELLVSSIAKTNAANFITDDVVELVSATRARETAFAAVVDAITDSTIIQINFLEGVVKSFGGIESFVEKTSFFFDNFFSESEKLAAKTKEVNQGIVELGKEGIITEAQVRMLTDGVGNLRQEFRSIVQGIEVVDESSAELLNTLLTFAPAIVEITDELEDAVAPLRSVKELLSSVREELRDGLKDFISEALRGGLDPDAVTDDVTTFIQDVFTEAITSRLVDDLTSQLIDSLINPIVLGTLESATSLELAIKSVQDRADNLTSIVTSPRFKNAVSEVSKAIADIVSSINDAIIPLFDRLLIQAEAALSNLIKSIDKEREVIANNLEASIARADKVIEGLNNSIDSVSDRIESLSEILSLLNSAISSFSTLSITQARKVIDDASTLISSGGTPEDTETIKSAITALTSTSTKDFGDATDFARFRNTNLAILQSFKDATTTQLTFEESVLLKLTESIKIQEDLKLALNESAKEANARLDAMLNTARASLDALNKIDNSVLSVVDALKAFEKVIAAALAAQAASTAAAAAASASVVPSSVRSGSSGSLIVPGGSGGTRGNRPLRTTGEAALALQSATSMFPLAPTTSRGRSGVLGAFADGGTVGTAGSYLVGEEGPEVVNLPQGAEVHNTQTSRDMLSNKDLIAEITLLREELNAILSSIAVSTLKSADRLSKFDNDGMPPVRS